MRFNANSTGKLSHGTSSITKNHVEAGGNSNTVQMGAVLSTKKLFLKPTTKRHNREQEPLVQPIFSIFDLCKLKMNRGKAHGEVVERKRSSGAEMVISKQARMRQKCKFTVFNGQNQTRCKFLTHLIVSTMKTRIFSRMPSR